MGGDTAWIVVRGSGDQARTKPVATRAEASERSLRSWHSCMPMPSRYFEVNVNYFQKMSNSIADATRRLRSLARSRHADRIAAMSAL